MKKFGFTLAEILISLSIIGVVAAIAAPSLSNITPSKEKAMFLKIYNSLSTAAQEVLDNPSYYYSEGNCMGFQCTGPILDTTGLGGAYSGSTKHCMLISEMLDINGNHGCRFTPIRGTEVIMGEETGVPGPIQVQIILPKNWYLLDMDKWGRLTPTPNVLNSDKVVRYLNNQFNYSDN